MVEDIRQVGFHMMSCSGGIQRSSGQSLGVEIIQRVLLSEGSVVLGTGTFLTSLLPFLSLLIEKEMSARALAPPTMLQSD